MRLARFSVIAGALAAALCSSPLIVAAQDQPIIGCVKPGTGLLRIPPPGEGCKNNEIPLGFNDFPMIVALKNLVLQLQADVQILQAKVARLESCTSTIPACSE